MRARAPLLLGVVVAMSSPPDVGQPTLEYAPAPSALSGVTLSAAPGGAAVITIHPTLRRVLRPILLFLLQIALISPLVLINLLSSRGRRNPWPEQIIIWSGLFAVFFLLKFVQQMVHVLHPARWEVDVRGITFTGRRLSDVVQQRWPREHIADLVVQRIRLKDQMLKRRSLVLVGRSGVKVVLARGTRAELDFLHATFRSALQLPPDPLHEADYPPAPPWWSRVSRRIIPGGVVITVRPRIPWLLAAMFLPALLAAVVKLDRLLFESTDV